MWKYSLYYSIFSQQFLVYLLTKLPHIASILVATLLNSFATLTRLVATLRVVWVASLLRFLRNAGLRPEPQEGMVAPLLNSCPVRYAHYGRSSGATLQFSFGEAGLRPEAPVHPPGFARTHLATLDRVLVSVSPFGRRGHSPRIPLDSSFSSLRSGSYL